MVTFCWLNLKGQFTHDSVVLVRWSADMIDRKQRVERLVERAFITQEVRQQLEEEAQELR